MCTSKMQIIQGSGGILEVLTILLVVLLLLYVLNYATTEQLATCVCLLLSHQFCFVISSEHPF